MKKSIVVFALFVALSSFAEVLINPEHGDWVAGDTDQIYGGLNGDILDWPSQGGNGATYVHYMDSNGDQIAQKKMSGVAGRLNSVSFGHNGSTYTDHFYSGGKIETPTWENWHYYVLVDEEEPPVVFDEYSWQIHFDNWDLTYGGSLVATLMQSGNSSLLSSDSFPDDYHSMISASSVSIERDVDVPPTQISLVVTHDSEGVFPYSSSFSLESSGTTASGGDKYFASIFSDIGDPTVTTNSPDPETDPLPIDPTNPPDPEPVVVPIQPPVGGGDTSPEVATNYDEFRKAVEKALDNRELSAVELEEAFNSALINAFSEKELSREAIQNAMENALYSMGQYTEKQRDAMQNALSRQGLAGSNIGLQVGNNVLAALESKELSADEIGKAVADNISSNSASGENIGDVLDERDLNADAIGKAVADNINSNGVGSLAGILSDIEDNTDGTGDTGGETESPTNGVGGASGDAEGDIEGMSEGILGDFADGVEDKLKSMFVLELPDIGTVTSWEYELPTYMGITLPTLRIDLTQYPFIPQIRMVLLFILYLGAFWKSIKIIEGAYTK
ncbi:MAG: hypothetical protein V3V05_10970 [Pontiella sp.]